MINIPNTPPLVKGTSVITKAMRVRAETAIGVDLEVEFDRIQVQSPPTQGTSVRQGHLRNNSERAAIDLGPYLTKARYHSNENLDEDGARNSENNL